jgi:tetratricopeptide (TPR) repeat protein
LQFRNLCLFVVQASRCCKADTTRTGGTIASMIRLLFAAIGFGVLAGPASATEQLWPLPAARSSSIDAGSNGPIRSVLAAPRHNDDRWRADPNAIDLPHGDPLTQPLNLSPAERGLFADASDGTLDGPPLLDAALVACGVNDVEALAKYDGKFAELRRELQRELSETPKPQDRLTSGPAEIEQAIRAIHYVLHKFVLVEYSAEATDLAGTLDTGVYNCASAALLFIAFGRESGLQANGVELPGHVRVAIETSDGAFEIEATCPIWKEAIRWNANSAANLAQSKSDSAQHRNVTIPGLLAMIYYNRGIDAFEQRRFADAVVDNRKAMLLDPGNSLARGNLLAAINNWALALCDAKQFAAAEELLREGLLYDPNHKAFKHNIQHVRTAAAQSASRT